MLAERRLKYLIELYESGRWKLYYNEPEFLKIVRDAHAGLKAWETLAPPEEPRDKPVEVELSRPVERPPVEPRSASIPIFTTDSLATPSLTTPSLAMRALRSSTHGIGTQYDLGKP
jgi:uncharacterized repeat protein (TIGR03809 family)